MPYSIQPSYEELQQTKKHPVAVALEAAMQGKMAYNQAQEFKAKREQQKQEAYFAFRKAGLSQSESWNRSQMGGPAPMGDDVFEMERKKGEAELKKTEAQARSADASANWMSGLFSGGEMGTGAVLDADTNQLRPAKPGEDPQFLIQRKKTGTSATPVPQPTTERIQMGSALDSMANSIDAMEAKITKDPTALVKSKIPFVEREFKAILDAFDKESAIAAGGKQLTETELALIRNTRPTMQDMFDPKAISYKLNKLRQVVANAKGRLGSGAGRPGTLETNTGLSPKAQSIKDRLLSK